MAERCKNTALEWQRATTAGNRRHLSGQSVAVRAAHGLAKRVRQHIKEGHVAAALIGEENARPSRARADIEQVLARLKFQGPDHVPGLNTRGPARTSIVAAENRALNRPHGWQAADFVTIGECLTAILVVELLILSHGRERRA